MNRPLYVRNAHLVKVRLLRYVPAQNKHTPWVGAPSVQVAYCTDPAGDTVISSLGPLALAEVDATNHPGWFYRVITAAETTILDDPAYLGTTIYERITAGAAGELRAVTPFVITEPRVAA